MTLDKNDMNKITIEGNVGSSKKEPNKGVTVLDSQDKTPKAFFSVATSEVFRDRDGKQKDKTIWHNVVIHGDEALKLKEVGKGAFVRVEGRLGARSYTPKGQDKKVWVDQIYADKVEAFNAISKGSKNEVEIRGPLKQDPEIVGDRVVLKVVTKVPFEKFNGETGESTKTHRCTAWGKKAAEECASLKAGDRVEIGGTARNEKKEINGEEKRFSGVTVKKLVTQRIALEKAPEREVPDTVTDNAEKTLAEGEKKGAEAAREEAKELAGGDKGKGSGKGKGTSKKKAATKKKAAGQKRASTRGKSVDTPTMAA